MENHKIEWHFENMLGIALIFGTSLFMHFFSDQDHFQFLFYCLGRVIAH